LIILKGIKMLSKECKDCKYCSWMVGIGQGVRCRKEENQKYKKGSYPGNVSISEVPEGCKYKEERD
jgi:hypothetical protein